MKPSTDILELIIDFYKFSLKLDTFYWIRFPFVLTRLCLHRIQNIVQSIQTNIVKSPNIAKLLKQKKEQMII